MRLRDLPFDLLVGTIQAIRRTGPFTVTWKDYPHIIIDGDSAEIEEYLRNNHHAEGMLLAYYYEGEDFNLRTPWGLDEEGKQLELHFRGKEREDGVEVIAHMERSRYEHKEDHINEIGFSWSEGSEEMVEIFKESPFEVLEDNT